MERLKGARYAYTKTRVAYLVPFIFLVPSILVGLLIYLLNSRTVFTTEFIQSISLPIRIVCIALIVFGISVARDLWRTFTRVTSEEIWITDRDIIWIGRKKKVLVKAAHHEIQRLVPLGQDFDKAWVYRIDTARGPIKFWRSMEHSDELIARIESFLNPSLTRLESETEPSESVVK
ncbi:MAG TPA: hypothetical protein VGL56_03145 [Fimbriimonadaceae bacterium]|jgi:hypothetical protein